MGTLKWQDCDNNNTEYTSRYDGAVRKVRDTLGSYDTIAQHIFRETGLSVAGVSVRRWLINRNLPVNLACTLVDLMDGEIHVGDFYPFLDPYFSI